MGKSLDFPQSVGVTVFRQKHQARGERGRSPALAGYAEFFFKIRADISNRRNRYAFHTDIIKQPAAFVKLKKSKKARHSLEKIFRLYYNVGERKFCNLCKNTLDIQDFIHLYNIFTKYSKNLKNKGKKHLTSVFCECIMGV